MSQRLLLTKVPPHPGCVYRSPKGLPMIYVRTEQLPGSRGPEHLFACTQNRVVFQLWLTEVPDDFELIIDTEGRRQATEQTWLTAIAKHDSAVLIELLKQACAWLPNERANELRQRWRERDMDADV